MKNYQLTPSAVERVLAGAKLLKIEDFERYQSVEQVEEGEVIALVDSTQQFVAKALIGRQHKGLAWVFTLVKYDPWSATFVEEVLLESVQRRTSYFQDTQTTAFRLFNGEGDGIGGVTVDWYAGFVQINWYSQGVYQYRQWFVEALCRQIPQLFGIYETCRFAVPEGIPAIAHTYGKKAPQPLVIQEHNIRYAIHLGAEWMTGLFLDQREVRQFVHTQSSQLSVLNLFSYTGGFSIAAACGGASRTVSVDVANRSLARTQENFQLNDVVVPNQQHEIRVMDVFDYVQYAKRHHLQFDLVVCDPPSFARTKDYQFRAEHDYGQLASQLFDLIAPGGLCIFSTNHSAYSRQQFLDDITLANKKHTGNFQLIQSFGLPMDFPVSSDEVSAYLKVFVFYRAS